MEHHSATKKNEIVPYAEMWMDPEIVMQSEIGQKQKNTYCILMHICRIQKNGREESICKAEIETDIEKNVWTPRGEKAGNKLGDWD